MPDEEVKAVAVKLPSFWTANAAAWFTQAEAQFALRKITQDETKYYYVVAALDADTATRANILLRQPPATEKYAAVKKFLLDAFEFSEAERAERLLSIDDLGDRKPSELMSAIIHLNGSEDRHFLLRHIFLRALPDALRQAVAASKEEDLITLAKEADRMASLVNTRPVTHVDIPEAQAVVKKKWKSGLCYFHQKFGARSRTCRQPCTWNSGNAMAGSQ